MSLNEVERRRTSQELRANLAASGLSAREAAEDLGFVPRQLRSVLDVDSSGDPVDVWKLRDYLDRAVRDAGRAPVPWTVLSESARRTAQRWFPLREAPRHTFPTGTSDGSAGRTGTKPADPARTPPHRT